MEKVVHLFEIFKTIFYFYFLELGKVPCKSLKQVELSLNQFEFETKSDLNPAARYCCRAHWTSTDLPCSDWPRAPVGARHPLSSRLPHGTTPPTRPPPPCAGFKTDTAPPSPSPIFLFVVLRPRQAKAVGRKPAHYCVAGFSFPFRFKFPKNSEKYEINFYRIFKSRFTQRARSYPVLLNNALCKITRTQILKDLFTNIYTCSYFEFLHACSYHGQ
jgi:hypothetical protein